MEQRAQSRRKIRKGRPHQYLIVQELAPVGARVYAPADLLGSCLSREGQKFDLTITRRAADSPDRIDVERSRWKRNMKMIKRSASLILLLTRLAVAAVAQQPAAAPTQPPANQPAAQQPAPPKTHLKVGQPAPDFTLTDTAGKEVKLSDFRGRQNVVLAFYVLAFTGG